MPSGDFHRNKTHCPQGHEYSVENTYWQQNRHGNIGRSCKECQKHRMQRKREHPEFKRREADKQARWRITHPEENRLQWQQAEAGKKQILIQARSGGCVQCGELDIACLDFHHRNGQVDKLGDIGTMRRFGTQRLLDEIAKCDVLCANCHRKHHRDEREARKRSKIGE